MRTKIITRWPALLGLGLGGCNLAIAQLPPGQDRTVEITIPAPGTSGPGLLGGYLLNRESSGTSWQPEATPIEGYHTPIGEGMFLAHGYISGAYGQQGGGRGEEGYYGDNMLLLMARYPLGNGAVGLRGTFSIEPATIGSEGYSELLQTGQTGNGQTAYLDHQHPSDFFTELAASYSFNLGDKASLFAYFGFPGEPALGPSTFMRRFSGENIPDAPLTQEWLDATRTTFGVETVGVVWHDFKLDASVFTGREPDEHRWDFDSPKFDSYSARITYNPSKAWSIQASYGNLNSPLELHPEVDIQRVTASVTYHMKWDQNQWQTVLAWGINMDDPGRNSNAVLLESAVTFDGTHTLFGRGEMAEKQGLFPAGNPREMENFMVGKIALGYVFDFPAVHQTKFGVGSMTSLDIIPSGLHGEYGDWPLSFTVFMRLKL